MPVGGTADPDAELLAELSHAFPPDPARRVGVAVSGGGDSMALLHLMQRVCGLQGQPLAAVTIDHGLRPGSADEAAMVGAFCATRGIGHAVLRWTHGPVAGNLMDAARKARHALIGAWARETGITHVALGHTADDQAETFLMALARSSGLDGLVGMPALWHEDGLWWARPLLRQSRAALRAYLRRNGLAWAEDPTNDDPRFERVRARRVLAALAPLGIGAGLIAQSMRLLAGARAALRDDVQRAAQAHVQETAGMLVIGRAGFAALHPEVQRLVLMTGLAWLSGKGLPPRHDSQTGLLAAASGGRDATLHGCRLAVRHDRLFLTREPRATGPAAPVGTLWDNRWMVEGPPGEVRALGARGLPQVKGWRSLGIPREALLVTPAVWDGDTLLAAPVAGKENGWKARIVTPFHRFAVSH